MFQNIVLFIKAISIVDGWFKKLAAFYVARELEKFQEADRDAIRKAVYAHDQRDLERRLGNSRPGEPSGIDGVERRDSIPGVVQDPEKK